MTDTTLDPHTSKNLRIAVILGGVVLGMVGAAYAAVPIYQLFAEIRRAGFSRALGFTLDELAF